jgi:hypothetical protein
VAQSGDLPIVVKADVLSSINVNTARERGIEFPPNILALADVVIE